MLWRWIIPTSSCSKVEMGGMDYQEGTAKMVSQEREERRERKEIKERLGHRDHLDLVLRGQPM